MKVGDLVKCTFGTDPVLCTVVSREHYDYWNILLRGRVITMHALYLELINESR
jgi:hypothetical protein